MGTRWQLTNAPGWQVRGGGEARERGVGWNQMACQAPRYVATSYKEGSLGTQPASNPPTFQSLFPPTVSPTTTPAFPGFLKDPSCLLAPAQVSPFLPPKSACLAPSPALWPPSGPSLSIPGQCPLTSPFCIPACNHSLLLGSHTPGDSEGSPGECSRATGGGSPTGNGR